MLSNSVYIKEITGIAGFRLLGERLDDMSRDLDEGCSEG